MEKRLSDNYDGLRIRIFNCLMESDNCPYEYLHAFPVNRDHLVKELADAVIKLEKEVQASESDKATRTAQGER